MSERPSELDGGPDLPSVLRAGARFEGLIALREPGRIDGCVSGEVVGSDLLWIGSSARVHARISAPEIVIAGEFEGEAEASGRIELLETTVGPTPNPNRSPSPERGLRPHPRRGRPAAQLGLFQLEVPVSYVKLPPLDLRRVTEPGDPPEDF
jgi:hypothetical protein